MNSQEILHADHLDILFDNRNKQYGAYMLRRNYNKRLQFSLGITITILPIIFLFFNTSNSLKINEQPVDSIIVRNFKLVDRKLSKVVPAIVKTKEPVVTQKKFTDRYHIVLNPKTVEDMTLQKDLENTIPGISSQSGVNHSGLQIEQEQNIIPEPPKHPDIKQMIQSDPEFPGGTKAWIGFLNRNLQVPGELDEGDRKTVLIRFQVATDGMITQFEVLQSAGSVYDNEVIRVLKKMPKWKPAIQNNVPVARSFMQPVTFMGVSN